MTGRRTDRELLAEYAGSRSEAAFAELVRRHAGKVHAAAVRILGDPHAAEDASQAAFLLLARRAARLGGREAVSGWLLRTASFVAAHALRERARRARREEAAVVHDEPEMNQAERSAVWREMAPHIDAALAALPASCRDALVLRHLDGLSQAEAAREMRVSETALAKRLQRGLDGLRAALARRGVTAPAAAIGAMLAEHAVGQAPAALVASIQATCGGGVAAGAGSVQLMQGAMKAMFWIKVKLAAAVVAAVTAVGGGGGLLAAKLAAGEPPRAEPAAPAAAGVKPSKEFPANAWVEVAREAGGTQPSWSNLVYDPVRGQVLHWGAPSREAGGAYAVHALDWGTGQWKPDYASGVEGRGKYQSAVWSLKGQEPVPHCAYDQVCYDPKRKQVVYAGPNMMMAYDPAARKWTDLKAQVELYGRKHPGGPPVYGGAMAYDPGSDEIVMFPHGSVINWDEHAETGRVRGHLGTFVYSFKDNLWRRTGTAMGPEPVRKARAEVLAFQGRVSRAKEEAWKLGIEPDKAKLAALSQTVAVLAGDVEKWSVPEGCGELKGKVAAALKAGAAAEKPGEAEDGCVTALGLLDEMLDRPLRVEPRERCFSRLVYDPKRECMVMFGGEHQDQQLNDTWIYDCRKRSWEERKPAVSPPPRADHAFVYHPKSGQVLMAGGIPGESLDAELWAYDVGGNVWQRLKCTVPWKAGSKSGWPCYSSMCAYDEGNDLVVLKHGDGVTYALRPDLGMKAEPTPWKPLAPERQELPGDDPAVLARLKALPANTWVPADPAGGEPARREYGSLAWDPSTGCVWYCGGGHSTYMGEDIAIYQPGANRWIRTHRPCWSTAMKPFPPGGFYWPDGTSYRGGLWADHLDQYAANRGRGFFPFAVQVPYTSDLGCYGPEAVAGWAREWKGKTGTEPWPMGYFTYDLKSRNWTLLLPRYADGKWVAGVDVIHRSNGATMPVGRGVGQMSHDRSTMAAYDPVAGAMQVQRVAKGEPLPPPPFDQGTDMAYCRGRESVFCWVTKRDKSASETWNYDLKTSKWEKLNPKENVPPLGACSRVLYVPDQDAVYMLQSQLNPSPQWVYSFKHNTWKQLDAKPHPGHERTGPYEQIVYCEKYGVFVWLGGKTGLLRPDFSQIKWE